MKFHIFDLIRVIQLIKHFLLIFAQIKYNQLEMSIYNIPWYVLPPSEARIIGFTLHRAQNGASFKIGPFSVLNFEIATKVFGLYTIVSLCETI